MGVNPGCRLVVDRYLSLDIVDSRVPRTWAGEYFRLCDTAGEGSAFSEGMNGLTLNDRYAA